MLSVTEYLMGEPVPLVRVHDAVFDFCRGREDVVVFGAQAVNFHVREQRMTQDVDLFSTQPRATAEALAAALRKSLHIAARVREVREGQGYRIYQARKQGKRHLADVRLLDFPLDDAVAANGLRFTPPALTIAMKVFALSRRRLTPKGATDLADLRRLLLAFPKLRRKNGPVAEAIARVGGGAEARAAWAALVREPIVSDEEADEGY